MSLFLTASEVREMTGLTRPHAQHRWLLEHQFTATRRADGAVLILRAHVEQRLGGASGARKQTEEPDWPALRSLHS